MKENKLRLTENFDDSDKLYVTYFDPDTLNVDNPFDNANDEEFDRIYGILKQYGQMIIDVAEPDGEAGMSADELSESGNFEFTVAQLRAMLETEDIDPQYIIAGKAYNYDYSSNADFNAEMSAMDAGEYCGPISDFVDVFDVFETDNAIDDLMEMKVSNGKNKKFNEETESIIGGPLWKQVVIDMVAADFESGLPMNDPDTIYQAMEEDEICCEAPQEACDFYLECVEMGPAGFLEEYGDVVDMSDDFVSEYSGDEDFVEEDDPLYGYGEDDLDEDI